MEAKVVREAGKNVAEMDEVQEGRVGLAVVGVITAVLSGWMIPEVGTLLVLAVLGALAVGAVVLVLTYLIAGAEAAVSGMRPRQPAVKRATVGAHQIKSI